MKTLLILLVLAYVGVATFAFFIADRLIFLPPSSSYAPGELPIVHLGTKDGSRVAVLYLPLDTARYTLLFSHGNAEDLGHNTEFFTDLRDRIGVEVVAYDYRGYGLSSGDPPTVKGAIRDIRAVYHYVTGELGVAPERVIVHGRSVGTGPTLELAASEPVGGVVIESGFISAYRVMTGIPLLPFDRFPNLRNVRRIEAPVLVIHGESDEVIASSHGRRLYTEAPQPKYHLWVAGARHNDLLAIAGESYWEELRRFVSALGHRREE